MPYYLAQITNPALPSRFGDYVGEGAGWGYFNEVVPNFVVIALIIGAVYFFFMLMTGAISWIASGGDKQKVENARKRITSAITGLVVLLLIFVFMQIVNRLFDINIGMIGSLEDSSVDVNPPPGAFENLGDATPGNLANRFISSGIQLLLIVATVAFFFMLLFGGIMWLSSAGDKLRLEAAGRTIRNALIGLLIVFSIFALIYIISGIFGVDFAGLQPPSAGSTATPVPTTVPTVPPVPPTAPPGSTATPVPTYPPVTIPPPPTLAPTSTGRPPTAGPPPAIECWDSDGGLDYYVAGTVTNEDGCNIADICVVERPGMLSEAFCLSDGVCFYQNYFCPGNRCRDGACY